MDIEKTIKNLESRGFKVSYFATGAEAADYVCGAVGGGSVGIGGSKTIEKLGLYERLSETNDVYWHWRTPGAETLRQEISADYFLSSAWRQRSCSSGKSLDIKEDMICHS